MWRGDLPGTTKQPSLESRVWEERVEADRGGGMESWRGTRQDESLDDGGGSDRWRRR